MKKEKQMITSKKTKIKTKLKYAINLFDLNIFTNDPHPTFIRVHSPSLKYQLLLYTRKSSVFLFSKNCLL